MITVTTTADDGPGSLRQAIVTANTSPGADDIRFRIPGGVAGDVHTISPLSPLPEVTGPTVIDGKPLAGPQPTHPVIEIDGSAAGPMTDGLSFASASGPNTIRGLAVNRFSRHGIVLAATAGNSTVQFCYVGTDPLGQFDRGNGGSGIVVLGPATIGGARGATTDTPGNVISGNAFAGIWLNPTYNATLVRIDGNNIGTDAAGSRAIGNGREGVLADSGQAHIGSRETAAPFSNLISGNGSSGIRTGSGAGSNTEIYSNYIGTDATGSRVIPNGTDALAPYHDGITNLGRANGFKVGLEGAGRNVISGNVGAGISTNGASSSLILGNYIGTDATGNADLGNGGDGLLLSGSVVGGSDGGPEQQVRDNVISGNGRDGIHVEWPATATIASTPLLNFNANRIGTNAAATGALGNDGDGIEVTGTLRGVIGFTSGTTISNIISANGGAGVALNGPGTSAATTFSIPILYNRIGTDITGNARLGNGSDGVRISGVASPVRVEGNQISANAGNGLLIANSGAPTPRSSPVDNNTIGTNAAGTAALGNGRNGIEVRSSMNVAVGANRRGNSFRNLISGNAGHGVLLDGPVSPDASPTSGHLLQGNFIGTDASGTIGLGNGGSGVFISARGPNQVGGADSLGNVISANRLDGITIVGGTITSSTNSLVQNRIQGNRIGTNAAGSDAINYLGNGGRGIAIVNSVNNIVGAEVDAANAATQGNTIAFNAGSGVAVEGTAAVTGTPGPADGNVIERNSIFSNGGLGIDLVNGYVGVTPNDPRDADGGPNGLQNFPLLSRATATGPAVTMVQYTLNSAPIKPYRIDFYASPAPDPSGFGEGKTYLGSVQVTTDSAGNASGVATLPAGAPVGAYVTATATTGTGSGTGANAGTSEFCPAIRITGPDTPSSVEGRFVFYNGSAFDRATTSANADDDAAIATDKQALLSGTGPATSANYTNYTRGLNGVMVDVLGLPLTTVPNKDDFSVRVGREAADGSVVWSEGPSPLSVAIRRDAGVNHSDRITLIWPNATVVGEQDGGAVRNGWLEVTLKSGARTGLARPDVFSFGNLVSETAGDALPARVTAADLAAIKRALGSPVSVVNRFDVNKDGLVNALDLGAARVNLNHALPPITAAAAPVDPAEPAPSALSGVLPILANGTGDPGDGVWARLAT